MSDSAQGPGWWRASDGRWYPPSPQASTSGVSGGPDPSPGSSQGDPTDVMATPSGGLVPPPAGPGPAPVGPGPALARTPPAPGQVGPPGAYGAYGASPSPSPPTRRGGLRGGARTLLVIGGLLAALVLVTGEFARIFLTPSSSLLSDTVNGIGGVTFVVGGRFTDFGDTGVINQASVLAGYLALLLGTAVLFVAAVGARAARGLALAAGILGLVAVGTGIASRRGSGLSSIRTLYVSNNRPYLGPLLIITIASILLLIGGLLPGRRT